MAKKEFKLSELYEKYKDKIKGGKGDSLTPDLVQRKQLIVGIYVELEHTKNILTAMEIALDHLAENSEYYLKLYDSGIIDEPKAVEIAKKYFISKKSKFKFVIPMNKWNESDF